MRCWRTLLPALLFLAGSLAMGRPLGERPESASAGSDRGQAEQPKSADVDSPRDGEQPPDPGPGDPNGMPPRERPFEQFRLMKMLELLDLTDDQEAPFLTAYHDMRKQNDKLDADKRVAIGQLSRALKARKPETKDINDLIDQLVSIEQQKREASLHFLDAARKILSPEQVGRLVLFVERFDSTVSQRLQAMRQRARGMGMRPRPDSGEGFDH